MPTTGGRTRGPGNPKKGRAKGPRADSSGLLDALEKAAVLVCRVSLPDGRPQYLSPALARLLGPGSRRHPIAALREAIQPDWVAAFDSSWSAVLEGGKTPHLEYPLVDRQGGTRWVHQLGAATRDGAGAPVSALLILHDVTERRRTEEALRASEERFRIAFRTQPDAVNLNRLADGCFVDINDGFTTLMGYTREEVLGRTSLDLGIWVNQRDRQRLVEGLRESGQVLNLEAEFRRKNGRIGRGRMSARLLWIGGDPHILSITRDVTESREAEERLRRHALLVETMTEAVIVTDPGLRLTDLNRGAERLLGRDRAALLGGDLLALAAPAMASRRELLRGDIADAVGREGRWTGELHFASEDGHEKQVEMTVVPLSDGRGRQVGWLGVARDITDRKRLEARFLQAQKMEVVGRLAGGIAHDFNNLLMAIQGYASLLARRLEGSQLSERAVAKSRGDVDQILGAADRAAGLTRQILAFGRKEASEPRILDLNALVRDLTGMLGRLIGEDVHLQTVLDPELGAVLADPGQMEQVLMNLAVNARDAMPRGGELAIETANVDLATPLARPDVEVPPGRYVRVAVRDDGVGMSESVLKHLFEPFFTTKPAGQGTGLGLATAYGIVKQAGGQIWAESEPGKGSTFEIRLPRAERTVEGAGDAGARPVESGGNETVLIAEDDPVARDLMTRALDEHGYSVLAAASAESALRVSRLVLGPIDLLVSDVVMPRAGGPQLAERLQAERPGLKVLYVSGYSAGDGPEGASGAAFLAKPFLPDRFVRMVREVLDS
jgi:two-component system cell cycle sensor histidine kinase/response regulator CckA